MKYAEEVIDKLADIRDYASVTRYCAIKNFNTKEIRSDLKILENRIERIKRLIELIEEGV